MIDSCSGNPPRGLALALVLMLGAASDASAQCGNNVDTVAVPECRGEGNSTDESCDAADALRIWPPGLRPGKPGQTLPEERDSSQWDSTFPAFSGSGQELFQSLDVVDDRLFVAFNSGIQAWDIGGPRAEDPWLLDFRDGYLPGHFLTFTPFGENDFWIEDIAAIRAPDGDETWLAVSGRRPVGLSLWRYHEGGFEQLYQEPLRNTRQVRVAAAGDRVYAYAVTDEGVHSYDLTHAASLDAPCMDAGGQCPGVPLGPVGTMTDTRYLDVLVRSGKIFITASDGNSLYAQPMSVEIWELTDPAAPATAVQRYAGAEMSSSIFVPTLFEHSGVPYLALVQNQWLEIYALGDCLENGCDALGTPLFEEALSLGVATDVFLTYSTSRLDPFLYLGLESSVLSGSRVERLLDLSTLGTTNEIVEITAEGEVYTDPCNGLEVDYWGDYYPRNHHGYANVSPRVGKFNSHYFYRAAKGILDVHVRSQLLLEDDFESGDLSKWLVP